MNKQIQIKHTLDFADITLVLVGAFEGGSNYWMYQGRDFPAISWGRKLKTLHQESPWAHLDLGGCYSDVMSWAARNGWHFKVTVRDDEGEGHNITPLTIERGVQVMQDKYPRHFADMVRENDDATTSDVLLQCILFEDVVYG